MPENAGIRKNIRLIIRACLSSHTKLALVFSSTSRLLFVRSHGIKSQLLRSATYRTLALTQNRTTSFSSDCRGTNKKKQTGTFSTSGRLVAVSRTALSRFLLWKSLCAMFHLTDSGIAAAAAAYRGISNDRTMCWVVPNFLLWKRGRKAVKKKNGD